MPIKNSSMTRLAEAVKSCAACPLGTQGGGVPGTWSDSALMASRGRRVLVLGEAPGGVEMIQGKPFVGQAGELLHSLFDEVGLTSYYISNVAKCRPPVVKGKQQAPDKVTTAACAPFLQAEFALTRPTHLILLGKTAAKLVVDGNFSMKDVVNTTIEYHTTRAACKTCGGSGKLVWSLHRDVVPCTACGMEESIRTSPWIQKAIREWKQSIKLFFGAEVPSYKIEEVPCEVHG